MYIEKCAEVFKNMIIIWLLLCESKLKLNVLNVNIKSYKLLYLFTIHYPRTDQYYESITVLGLDTSLISIGKVF